MEVSGKIINAIRDLNGGANGTIPESRPITHANIHSFLKTPRGLALVFWAMNNKGQFYADIDEWRLNKPRASVVTETFLDCHTHYLGERPAHWANQYREGARGHWWLFPEAYSFGLDGNTIAVQQLLNPEQTGVHGRLLFKMFMLDLYDRTAGRLRFFTTPAPGQGKPLNGADDTAPYTDMLEVCEEVNGLVKKRVCCATGVVRSDSLAPKFFPENPAENGSKLWKIYPGKDWPAWLSTTLPSALDLLDTKNHHTILIHWWDDVAQEAYKLEQVVKSYPNVRFVVFHAFHPNYEQLRDLLMKYKNLFAEIGGVFANNILGYAGNDGGNVLGDSDTAKNMIQVLRGGPERVGVNDDQILWGTDAIWHGSAIWQLEAFCRLKLISESKDATFKRKVLQKNPKSAFWAFSQFTS